MAGNSNSGRRPLGDRQKRQAVIDKAWDLMRLFLEDVSIPIEKRVETARVICAKDMPNKLSDENGNTLQRPVINIFATRNEQNRLLPAPEGSASVGDTQPQV